MSGFSNTILGGAKKLIREAIQSINYVAGVSGWTINKDGSSEFGNAVIRGSLSADGGNVLLNDSGLSVTGASQKFVITDTEVKLNGIPDDGGYIKMQIQSPFGGVIFLEPNDSAVGGVTFDPGQLFAANDDVGGTSARPYTKLRSPFVNPNLHSSQVVCHGQYSDSATDNSFVEIIGDLCQIGGTTTTELYVPFNGGCNPIENFDASVTNGTTGSTTFVDSLTTTGVLGVSFIAPKSGGVWIHAQAGCFNATVGATMFVDFQVRNGSTVGSGTVFRAGNLNACGEHQSATANHIGMASSDGYVAGLTPGNAYNATICYATTSGTGNFRRRKISLSPNIISF